MLRIVLFVFFVTLMGSLGGVQAQDPTAEPVLVGESGEEYLRAIRFRGVDSDVSYFGPSGPPPELSTSQAPPSQRDSEERRVSDPQARALTTLITVAILAGLGFLLYRYGDRIVLSMDQEAENQTLTGRNGRRRRDPTEIVLTPIDDLLDIPDRRKALILLSQTALATMVAAQGVLLQTSWTAREALRHIPRDLPGLSSLRALVLDSERVQFGGRDVTEEEFQTHVTAARMLLQGRAVEA